MPKRFTDTDIWKKQRWFKKLPPEYKLVFFYIKDQCNNAGVWRIDCFDLIEDLGLVSFDLESFVTAMNTEYDKLTGSVISKERLTIFGNNLIINSFVQFQYEGKDGKINHESLPVRSALLTLEKIQRLDEGLAKGYLTLKKPLDNGWQTVKDKDKDKEKEIKNKSISEEIQKGKKFSEDKKSVIFEDGSFQPLGPDQLLMLERQQLHPKSVVKGSKY